MLLIVVNRICKASNAGDDKYSYIRMMYDDVSQTTRTFGGFAIGKKDVNHQLAAPFRMIRPSWSCVPRRPVLVESESCH